MQQERQATCAGPPTVAAGRTDQDRSQNDSWRNRFGLWGPEQQVASRREGNLNRLLCFTSGTSHTWTCRKDYVCLGPSGVGRGQLRGRRTGPSSSCGWTRPTGHKRSPPHSCGQYSSLNGSAALEILGQLSKGERHCYKTLVGALQRRYGSTETRLESDRDGTQERIRPHCQNFVMWSYTTKFVDALDRAALKL